MMNIRSESLLILVWFSLVMFWSLKTRFGPESASIVSRTMAHLCCQRHIQVLSLKSCQRCWE